MSKPEGVPQDVWDAAAATYAKARELTDKYGASVTATHWFLIASAIMAERERCAKLADGCPTTRMIDGPQIATLIRKGSA